RDRPCWHTRRRSSVPPPTSSASRPASGYRNRRPVRCLTDDDSRNTKIEAAASDAEIVRETWRPQRESNALLPSAERTDCAILPPSSTSLGPLTLSCLPVASARRW